VDLADARSRFSEITEVSPRRISIRIRLVDSNICLLRGRKGPLEKGVVVRNDDEREVEFGKRTQNRRGLLADFDFCADFVEERLPALSRLQFIVHCYSRQLARIAVGIVDQITAFIGELLSKSATKRRCNGGWIIPRYPRRRRSVNART
jgi:hypothetical protein